MVKKKKKRISNKNNVFVKKDNVVSMFDRIADRYDLLNNIISFWQAGVWRNRLVDMLPVKNDNPVLLDIATGTGEMLFAIKKKKPKYSKLKGIDISDRMLSLANSKKIKKGQDISFTKMSAEDIEYDDFKFDILTIVFGLRNLKDKKKSIDNFYRILKKDGSLFIMEFFNPDVFLFKNIFNFYFNKILPLIGFLLSDKKAYKYLPASVKSFYKIEKLLEILKSYGFSIKNKKKMLWGSVYIIEAVKV